MDEVLYSILIQAACYGGVMALMVFGVAFLMRGFFWKYIKVKSSMGKYLLIKIRTVLRDYYVVGWIEEGFLVYKVKEGKVKIAVNATDKFIYRSIGINWVDVDGEKNAIAKCDYSAISGFDAQKFSDLEVRCLQRPVVSSGQDKIILICVIFTALAVLGILYFVYMNNVGINAIPDLVAENFKAQLTGMKGTVSQAATI